MVGRGVRRKRERNVQLEKSKKKLIEDLNPIS